MRHAVPTEVVRSIDGMAADFARLKTATAGLTRGETLGSLGHAKGAASRIKNSAAAVQSALGRIIAEAERQERAAIREAERAERNNARILLARGMSAVEG